MGFGVPFWRLLDFEGGLKIYVCGSLQMLHRIAAERNGSRCQHKTKKIAKTTKNIQKGPKTSQGTFKDIVYRKKMPKVRKREGYALMILDHLWIQIHNNPKKIPSRKTFKIQPRDIMKNDSETIPKGIQKSLFFQFCCFVLYIYIYIYNTKQ